MMGYVVSELLIVRKTTHIRYIGWAIFQNVTAAGSCKMQVVVIGDKRKTYGKRLIPWKGRQVIIRVLHQPLRCIPKSCKKMQTLAMLFIVPWAMSSVRLSSW